MVKRHTGHHRSLFLLLFFTVLCVCLQHKNSTAVHSDFFPLFWLVQKSNKPLKMEMSVGLCHDSEQRSSPAAFFTNWTRCPHWMMQLQTLWPMSEYIHDTVGGAQAQSTKRLALFVPELVGTSFPFLASLLLLPLSNCVWVPLKSTCFQPVHIEALHK